MVTYNYLVGVPLSDVECKRVDEKRIQVVKGKKYLVLSKTFNTSLHFDVEDCIQISVEEAWRHSKESKYWYSLHKPTVHKRVLKPPSEISDVEDIVVSRGVAVTHGEESVDFPKSARGDYIKVMKSGKWMPYVSQWHYRGHRISLKERKEGSIPNKFIYKLDSLHNDLRLSVGDHLQGFTLFTPSTSDPGDTDDFVKGDAAGKGKIRFVTKIEQPKEWLSVNKFYDVGGPGTTPTAPAVFVIVACGEYKVLKVEGNVIRVVFRDSGGKGKVDMEPLEVAKEKGVLITRSPPGKLKDLSGVWQFNWSHIGEKYVGLLRWMGDAGGSDRVNNAEFNKIIELIEEVQEGSSKPLSVDLEALIDIHSMTGNGCFRGDISDEVGLSKKTIYNWQKRLGFY